MTVKGSVVALALLASTLCCPADSFRLDGLQGMAYRPGTNIEVVWAATNMLPAALWIYKVAPQEFSTAIVSNLMSICDFHWKNLNKITDSDVADQKLICLTDRKQRWTRCLEIAPTLGWIEYNADSDPTAFSNSAPSKAEVEKVANNVLFELGIDRSLVCEKHNGYETVRGKLSPDGHRLSTNVISRGISFSRKIDGIESQNVACFMLVVESNGRIKRLLLNWRHLLPYEPRILATANEIIDSIKAGRAILPPQSGDLSGIDEAVRLTITDIMLRYYDTKGSKPLDFSYPFAAVKVLASIERTNTVSFCLECPILSTNRFLLKEVLKH